jgi:hypothetical protein
MFGLNQAKLTENFDRSLMMVIALSPVIGYDKAAAVSYYAIDHNQTLKQAALANGASEELYDRVIDRLALTLPGPADAAPGARNPVTQGLPPIWLILGWIDEQDSQVNPLGVKGIGELGVVGTAAAIANAVWHAIGVRYRTLPLTPPRVLQGTAGRAQNAFPITTHSDPAKLERRP